VVLIERAGAFPRVPDPGTAVITLTHCLPGRLALHHCGDARILQDSADYAT
jgi:hypothetical protein